MQVGSTVHALTALPRQLGDDIVRQLDSLPAAHVLVDAQGIGTFASKSVSNEVSRKHLFSQGVIDEMRAIGDDLNLPDIFDARKVTKSSTTSKVPIPRTDAVSAPVFLRSIEPLEAASIDDARRAASAKMLSSGESTGLLAFEDGKFAVGRLAWADEFPSIKEVDDLLQAQRIAGNPRVSVPDVEPTLVLGHREREVVRRYGHSLFEVETTAPPAIDRLDLRGKIEQVKANDKGWWTTIPRLPEDMNASVEWRPAIGELDAIFGKDGMIAFR